MLYSLPSQGNFYSFRLQFSPLLQPSFLLLSFNSPSCSSAIFLKGKNHDLHIWALGTTDAALTVHLTTFKQTDINFVTSIQHQLNERFGIEHATIQVEFGGTEDCGIKNNVEELIPESQSGNETDLSTIGAMIGFVTMMFLDVTLV